LYLPQVEMESMICCHAPLCEPNESGEKKLTEKEAKDSIDDWENCKGQCGHTRFCRHCMQERDRLIREKNQAKRKRMEEAT
jgi:hypothetical protein